MSKMINRYRLAEDGEGVIRSDGSKIPESEGNSDWLYYLEWLSKGNVPSPVVASPEKTVDELRREDILKSWPVYEQLEALTEKAMGRTEKFDQLQVDIEAIKLKYPKEI